jgi:hypothetical protein
VRGIYPTLAQGMTLARLSQNAIFAFPQAGMVDEDSIWVDEADLGGEKLYYSGNARYFVKIPDKINKTISLRLPGLGRIRQGRPGILLLHLWLNKGVDVNWNLWLSETAARNGTNKKVLLDGNIVTLVIPPASHHGLTIRLRGYGRVGSNDPRAPQAGEKKKGNALVRLNVYPDSVTPRYESFEALSTEDMAQEGWVYLKFDFVVEKLGGSLKAIKPLSADTVADAMNERGWEGIFESLKECLGLADLNISLEHNPYISQPGTCQETGTQYKITINDNFLDNPFTVAAILAHELCHVIYSFKITERYKESGEVLMSENARLEEEHAVDLLVFMFGLGEFQLRVARDKRLTIGYFDQAMFDRMQVIVSKKLNSL